MIEIDGVEYYTEAQWNKKHRAILKRQRNKGIWREWYIDKKHVQSATFYREDQTRSYNQRELQAARKAQRELIATRKKRLSCRCCGEYFGKYARLMLEDGLCEFCSKDHTAWQWLAITHLAPKKNAKAYGVQHKCWDSENRKWIVSNRIWYYYSHNQVFQVSDDAFEILKDQYIQLFGGWEQIDLEHTKYDGKKWW